MKTTMFRKYITIGMNKMKEELIQLFEDAQFLIKKFDKQTYETGFQNQFQKYEAVLKEAEEAVEQADAQEMVIRDIASIIPEYVKEKNAALHSKRKAENAVIDYNYAMVTYVLPLINYRKTENSKRIAEELLHIWNQEITKTPIKNSTYESIYEGFSQRLCYITTAVCESLGKPDDCHELQVLRGYRDEYLMGSEEGKDIVMKYYDIAPTIVKRINEKENAGQIYQRIYTDYLVPCIQLAENQKLEECKETYRSMVQELQNKYIYS